MKLTILQIAGKPGLYKLVSKGNRNLIIESIDDTKRRIPTFPNDKIISLTDIAIYTDEDDIPLMNVFASMFKKEEEKQCSIDFKKATSNELRAYMSEILPDYDKERVKDSDIRKLIQWYNILVKYEITDFEEEEEVENNEDTSKK